MRIGPVQLFANADSGDDEANLPGTRGLAPGRSWSAVALVAPDLEANLRFFIAEDGAQGIVDCRTQGTSTAFDRLTRGARLGVYQQRGNTYAIRQLRVLRLDPSTGWGNPTATSLEELDRLAGGAFDQLAGTVGISQIGTKAAVIGDKGNDIALTWDIESGPGAPLAAYVLTRIVPIANAIGTAAPGGSR